MSVNDDKKLFTKFKSKYLLAFKHLDNKRLPMGPVILSPDGLITSFKREVIDRRPQEFKIASLTEIKNLFGNDASPFYSGFGNRSTVNLI